MNLLHRYVQHMCRTFCRWLFLPSSRATKYRCNMRCHVCQTCQVLSFFLIVAGFFLFQDMVAVQSTYKQNNTMLEVEHDANLAALSALRTQSYAMSGHQDTQHNCERLHLIVPCLIDWQLRDMPILLKSVLLHTHISLITLHLVTTATTHTPAVTLLDTWGLPQVSVVYHVVELDQIKPESLLDSVGLVLRKMDSIENNHKYIAIHPLTFMVTDLVKVWRDMSQILKNEGSEEFRGLLMVHLVNTTAMFHLETQHLSCRDKQHMLIDDPLSIADQKALWSVSCVNSSIIENKAKTAQSWLKVTKVATVVLPPGVVYGKSSLEFGPLVEHYLQMVSLDGDIFRTMTTPCSRPVPEPLLANLSTTNLCYEYQFSAHIKRRTHMNFFSLTETETNSSDVQPTVTLVTQLLFNRINALERLLGMWQGPASVSLYLTDEESVNLAQFIRESPIMSAQNDVQLHIVYKRHKYYPINYLRNIAIREVKTPFYLMLDVDFVPSHGLADEVQNVLSKLSTEKKRALIVPTFETQVFDYKPPKTKTNFLKDISTKKVLPYHQKKGMWKKGHSYTNYDKWMTAAYPYRVRGKFGYEPYIVMPVSGPMYHDVLLERMRDKLTYTVEVEKAGYELFVLPEAFTVHLPHPKSISHKYGATKKFQKCARQFYDNIIVQLRKKYGR